MYVQHEQNQFFLMKDKKTEQVGRRRMQILQGKYKRKTFCVISVANENSNNRDTNAVNKKGLKNVVSYTHWHDGARIAFVSSTVLYFEVH